MKFLLILILPAIIAYYFGLSFVGNIWLFLCGLIALWVLLRLNKFDKTVDVFNLYFGSPGCGKTSFLVADAKKFNKKGYKVFSNICIPETYKFDKSYIGKYAFPEGSILLFDEGSLNGFDNRDYKSNFRENPDCLGYLKLLRHYSNKIIFYNQGYDELDKKIRTLTIKNWIVKRIGPFSVATLVRKRSIVDKETHTIVDGFFMPNIFSLIFSRRCTRIIYRPNFYADFDSYDKPLLNLEPVPLDYWDYTLDSSDVYRP